jgi:hypothetical protein
VVGFQHQEILIVGALGPDPLGNLLLAAHPEGQVRVFTEGGNTIVQVNNDGDLLAEGEIQLTGNSTWPRATSSSKPARLSFSTPPT